MHPIFSGSRFCIALGALALACIASPSQATRLLTFEPILTAEEETYILQSLGQSDIVKTSAGRPVRLSYSLVDLNGDGVFEIAVRASADGEREEICHTTLLMKSGPRWLKMLDTEATKIAIGERSQYGIRNLLIGESVMVWTGSDYVAAR